MAVFLTPLSLPGPSCWDAPEVGSSSPSPRSCRPGLPGINRWTFMQPLLDGGAHHPHTVHWSIPCSGYFCQISLKIRMSMCIFLSVCLFYIFYFYTTFKGYFLFTVITKYWLHSPCCTIHLWAYLTSNTLYLPLPPTVLTTSLFFISVSLLLFCYIH